MQTKSSSNSRAANSAEKAHMQWIKDRGKCAACSVHTNVICHHAEGAMFKQKVDFVTVHIGHWFVIGLCKECDDIVTHKSRKLFRDKYGLQSELWLNQMRDYDKPIPKEVIMGIAICGK
jgi:hypothetical protein